MTAAFGGRGTARACDAATARDEPSSTAHDRRLCNPSRERASARRRPASSASSTPGLTFATADAASRRTRRRRARHATSPGIASSLGLRVEDRLGGAPAKCAPCAACCCRPSPGLPSASLARAQHQPGAPAASRAPAPGDRACRVVIPAGQESSAHRQEIEGPAVDAAPWCSRCCRGGRSAGRSVDAAPA